MISLFYLESLCLLNWVKLLIQLVLNLPYCYLFSLCHIWFFTSFFFYSGLSWNIYDFSIYFYIDFLTIPCYLFISCFMFLGLKCACRNITVYVTVPPAMSENSCCSIRKAILSTFWQSCGCHSIIFLLVYFQCWYMVYFIFLSHKVLPFYIFKFILPSSSKLDILIWIFIYHTSSKLVNLIFW